MNAIAVIDQNRGLGRDGELLVHLPGDLRYFKEKTLGKTIIIGRKTFEGMGRRLLPGRETILLTQKEGYEADCPQCHSLEALFARIKDKDSAHVFVAGGEAVYRLLLPFCDTLFITKVYAAFAADRHFPDILPCTQTDVDKERDIWGGGAIQAPPQAFEIVWRGEEQVENGVRYQFFEYRRMITPQTSEGGKKRQLRRI
ncbi:MAG: dihydrofolate reductase [Oscillospiraceae bacterium]|nr:dihydrofolate reductase [Oscillospiraceae bacterium]